MNKKILTLLAILFATFHVHAQQADPVVFTINGNPVYKSEIAAAYKKGNEHRSEKEKESINDFIRSYIYFKQNVAEARLQQIDTTSGYNREFLSLREQLAKPFLTDTIYGNAYVTKIYKRLLENIEINHILIPFENRQIVLPSDTVSAYKKALFARENLLSRGFDSFKKNSRTAITIDNEQNDGYMGWIAPFMLSPAVEDAVYTLPIGEISMPIRTTKGYHVVQVLNKRPAVGSAEVEQVVFGFSQIPPSQHQIDSVRKVAEREYKAVKSKNSFQTLCEEFAAAHKTGDRGCYFGLVSIDSKLPASFVMASLGLKEPGDVSKPVLSDYGFHIIRLIRKLEIGKFEDLKDDLRSRILASNKAINLTKEKRKRLFDQFSITVNNSAFDELLGITEYITPKDSMFLSHIKNKDELLLDIEGERKYTVEQFANYIKIKHKELYRDPNELLMNQVMDLSPFSLSSDILKDYFESFKAILVEDYAKATLEKRNPEFRKIMNDVSEELLSYEVQNKNIWNRSKTDENGLSNYFKANKAKYKFTGQKYKGVVVYSKNEETLKEAETLFKKAKNREQFINNIRRDLNSKSIQVLLEPGTWVEGDNKFVDYKIFGRGESPVRSGYPFFFVTGKFIGAPEEYTDARSEVEFDYQAKLEKDWQSYLNNKYKVEINQSVVNTIK